MAFFPYYHKPLEVIKDHYCAHEPQFGLDHLPDDLYSDDLFPRSGSQYLPNVDYLRPWAYNRQAPETSARKNIYFEKDGFHVDVDVHQFDPSEITVKTVNNTVVIEGKHGEKEDEHGLIERHYVRKYFLPKDVDAFLLHSELSSDGVLSIKAPPALSISRNERNVPVFETNIPVHSSVKK